MTVTTWNMEWANPGRSNANMMLERMAALDPDIICLTEAYKSAVPPHGHLIEAEADYGYPLALGRRKVLLWSREPWAEVDQVGSRDLPSGRYIAGRTSTPLGPVTVIGVCIPWRDAHVRTGRRDRSAWEDHRSYLAGLREKIGSASDPVIMVGDFNQEMPRTWVPEAVYEDLVATLAARFNVATTGLIEPLGLPAIDHIAHTHDLASEMVTGLSNIGADGKRLSDHFGLAVTLRSVQHP